MNPVYRPYAPRLTRRIDLLEVRGVLLRRWWIDLRGEHDAALAGFAPALALAEAALPAARVAADPGVGFLILHRGYGADYLVLGRWARQNELPLRVFVRYPDRADDAWRAAREDESVCVWDLEVIAREREAYVGSWLAGLPAEQALAAWRAAL